jgi:hypothetical protein
LTRQAPRAGVIAAAAHERDFMMAAHMLASMRA